MREFLKLDVIFKKISKTIKSGNKAKKIISAISFVWTVFNVVAVIWTLIPKNEKLSGVDGDELAAVISEGIDDKIEETLPKADVAEALQA